MPRFDAGYVPTAMTWRRCNGSRTRNRRNAHALRVERSARGDLCRHGQNRAGVEARPYCPLDAGGYQHGCVPPFTHTVAQAFAGLSINAAMSMDKYLTLQRHFSVLTKFAHVESRLSGRNSTRKVVFYAPVNLYDRRACSASVAVGLIA